MATTTLQKVTVKMNLNNGTNPDGTVKTVSVSLGTLNPLTYDADMALLVVTALEEVLSKTLVNVTEVKTSRIVGS